MVQFPMCPSGWKDFLRLAMTRYCTRWRMAASIFRGCQFARPASVDYRLQDEEAVERPESRVEGQPDWKHRTLNPERGTPSVEPRPVTGGYWESLSRAVDR